MPAAARGTTPAAAKAFARYYFATINYAALSGDVSGLRSLSESGCKSCNTLIKNITKIYRAGGHIESENWEVTSATVAFRTPRVITVDLGVTEGREVIVPRVGATPRKRSGGKQPMTLYAHSTAGGWTVAKLRVVPTNG